jgi:retron-type reverse transcriptase
MTSADTTDKPFKIEKRLVYQAYKAVKSKGGAAGVDGQTIEQFEANLDGYRPRKSALNAVGVTRERCWKYDWVVEFDIRGLFDNIDHELLLRAVRKHVKCEWALLYIERWLTAPMEQDGIRLERNRGTPQGA